MKLDSKNAIVNVFGAVMFVIIIMSTIFNFRHERKDRFDVMGPDRPVYLNNLFTNKAVDTVKMKLTEAGSIKNNKEK